MSSWAEGLPRVTVAPRLEPKAITVIYPYYEQPAFTGRQLLHLGAMPEALRAHVSVMVIDDGSKEWPIDLVLEHLDPQLTRERYALRLFAIEVDVRWNWLAARNIGAHHAAEGWILLTDIDHVIPPATLEALVYGAHDPGTIYGFTRQEHTGEAIHPHPNSWFLTRAMFWRIGGYDEALSGHYGTDSDFRRRAKATAPIAILTDRLERWEFQGDSSTTRYERRQPEDHEAKRRIAARRPDWRPRWLSFPYHEVPTR